jgi:hypothetical protein
MMKNKKRVREAYFYKDDKGTYKVQLLDVKNNVASEPFSCSNRLEAMEIIDLIKSDIHGEFSCSSLGLKIYNKRPDQRILTKSTESIFDVYVRNLCLLKENEEYSAKVANLLKSVADLIEPDEEKCCGDHDSVLGIEPRNPISNEIPLDVVSWLQDGLDVSVNFDDLTFWFQDQKWQITKDLADYDLPSPKLPKTSHNILGTMEYMINLLGVNAERNREVGENSFRFVLGQEVYKIKHVYTGDHNTFRRDS